MASKNGPTSPKGLIFPILILFLLCYPATGATITVQPGESIQEAIDQASPGDRIEVQSGTYTGSLSINKQIALIGVDTGEGIPVLDAGSILSSIFVTANESEVSGFRILNSNGDGIDVTSDHVKITNNTIEACGAAIYLMLSEGNTVSSNNISVFCRGVMGLLSSDGIMLTHSNNNIIENNSASGASMGVYLYYSHNNTVSKNTARDCDHGIAIMGSRDNRIEYNTVQKCTDEGVGLLDGCRENIISRNNVTANTIGIFLQESDNNSIYLNDFVDNIQNARSTDSDNTWHSLDDIAYSYSGRRFSRPLGNYWSDYNGQDTDGDGVGDSSYSFEGDKDDHPLMIQWSNLIAPRIFHKGIEITS